MFMWTKVHGFTSFVKLACGERDIVVATSVRCMYVGAGVVPESVSARISK